MIYNIDEIEDKKKRRLLKRVVNKILNEEKKIRDNKPDNELYTKLLIGSLILIIISFFLSFDNRLFTITAGFGCSGIASVVVAWLIERSTYTHKEKVHTRYLDYIFMDFDSHAILILNRVLELCIKNNEKVNMDKEFTIEDIYEIVQTADPKYPEWIWYYQNLGKGYASIDASLLLSDENNLQNIEMYSDVRLMQDRYNSFIELYSNFNKTGDVNGIMAYRDLCNDIKRIQRIFMIRCKQIPFILSDEFKESIRNKRAHSQK